MIVLRFLHVVFGALWVGMFAFMSFILLPAFARVGPEGAKVQAALAKRRRGDWRAAQDADGARIRLGRPGGAGSPLWWGSVSPGPT